MSALKPIFGILFALGSGIFNLTTTSKKQASAYNSLVETLTNKGFFIQIQENESAVPLVKNLYTYGAYYFPKIKLWAIAKKQDLEFNYIILNCSHNLFGQEPDNWQIFITKSKRSIPDFRLEPRQSIRSLFKKNITTDEIENEKLFYANYKLSTKNEPEVKSILNHDIRKAFLQNGLSRIEYKNNHLAFSRIIHHSGNLMSIFSGKVREKSNQNKLNYINSCIEKTIAFNR